MKRYLVLFCLSFSFLAYGQTTPSNIFLTDSNTPQSTGAKLILADGPSQGVYHSIGASNFWTEFRSHTNEGWKFLSGSTPTNFKTDVIIRGTGQVGIGTNNPEVKLHLNTNSSLDGLKLHHNNSRFATFYSPSMILGAMNPLTKADDAGIIYGNSSGDHLQFGFVIAPWRNNESGLRMDHLGNVGIATADTRGYRLAVNGGALFTQVKVMEYGAWPDYVFSAGYSLRPLAEVERFIKENGHLPEVPSATEVAKNGLDVGTAHAILLKKVEELTLYVIELQKQVEMLKKAD